MRFLFYILGGFFFIIFSILKEVIFGSGVALTQPSLINYAITAAIAMLGFALADFIMNRNRA